MSDMTEIQQARVADRIAALEREGAAIRAERTRDHLRVHPDHAEAGNHPADLPSRRVRLGQWLVGVGEAIAGSTRPSTHSMARATERCDDGSDRLHSAA